MEKKKYEQISIFAKMNQWIVDSTFNCSFDN